LRPTDLGYSILRIVTKSPPGGIVIDRLRTWLDRNGTEQNNQTEEVKPFPSSILEPGVQAPDFSLPSSEDGDLALNSLLGQPVILAFYPADWSPVCGDQMVLYNEILEEFQHFDAALLGLSVDGIWSHRAFAKDRNLQFPLLSDFEPKGQVARLFGVYDRERGKSRRALFVLDPEHVIRWSHLSPPNVNPGADGILRALESL
jgi:peroxiredoxin